MTEPLTDWLSAHPTTSTYIAIVVTLSLVLQILEALGVV